MEESTVTRNKRSDIDITSTPVATQPVTTLHVALYGIDGNDGRLVDLIDRIDRWADDNLGEEPTHSRDTHYGPVRSEAST